MGKFSWTYAVMALGAIMLIAANFRKIGLGLNLVLVSLVLLHIAAWFISPGITYQLYMLVISVIIYLLFYFTKGK